MTMNMSASVSIEENEVIRLIVQFLSSRKLHKSTRNLERESGITNCSYYNEDVLFLRQLTLDGEWDAILTFAQPLEQIEGFDAKKFRYLVLKEKFMEILYFKSGFEGSSSSYSIDYMIKCLEQLEKNCPVKSDYTKLCWLLTVPDLYDQPEYKDWNPETARLECFGEIVQLLRNVIPLERENGSEKVPHSPAQNRLVTLIVKGLCFESCVDYCHQRAVSGELHVERDVISISQDVLCGSLHESTGNFLSWLHSLPRESFVIPFDPMSLKVDLKKSLQNKNFQLSNKRLQNEAGNLSKSLSITTRPSTASKVESNAVPAALAGVKKVSSSYSGFHYTQPNMAFRPIHPDSTNAQDSGIHRRDSLNEADVRENVQSPDNRVDTRPSPDRNDNRQSSQLPRNVIEDRTTAHTTDSGIMNKPTLAERGIYDSQDSLDQLKRKQEYSVLRQLEEHERQQAELRRQLMENSNAHAVSSEISQPQARLPSDRDCMHSEIFHEHKSSEGFEDRGETSSQTTGYNRSNRLDNVSNPSNRMHSEILHEHKSSEGFEHRGETNSQTNGTNGYNRSNRLDNVSNPSNRMHSDILHEHKSSEGFEDRGETSPQTTGYNRSNRLDNVSNPSNRMHSEILHEHKSSENFEHRGETSPQTNGTNSYNRSHHLDNVSNPSNRMQREPPVGKEVSPSFKDEPKPPTHITSTPVAKKKSIPEPLKLDNVSISHIEGPSTNESQHKNHSQINQSHRGVNEPEGDPVVVDLFPKTPIANMFPPGHWIALTDGSGIMNTSTPKSCRQKMYNTPCPPESPVSSAISQPNFDNVCDVAGTEGEQIPYYGVQDKAGPVIPDNETSTTRRGPKINGVRRTLVSNGPPMARNKGTPTLTEETREAKTPRQDKATPKSKNQSSLGNTPRDHPSANQKQGIKKKMNREDSVKPKTVGNTFVVGHVAQDLSTKPGKTNSDIKQGAANVTYHKPANKQSTVNQQQREISQMMERQRKHLESNTGGIRFCAVASLEDVQAIRAVAFHPSGDLFAIGSNSKTLRVCAATGLNAYKKLDSNEDNLVPPQPTILFKRNRHHRGSIYCVTWNNTGDMIATGSNDKTIKVLRFDAENCTQSGPEMELNIHSGTVRDLAFAHRSGGTTVLVSGGAGNNHIQISDCSTGNTVGQLKSHSGHIMSIFAAKDDIIASGSNDNTVRLWDLRSQRCIDAIATGDSCVNSVCVNSAGTLLSSGHEDGGCMIYDITAGRTLQSFKPHTLDCRSVRFSPDGHYLLTASYDTSVILLDLQHNLECSIPPYCVVAQHRDKVIQCRWHPKLMAFVSSSADKRACLWTLDC